MRLRHHARNKTLSKHRVRFCRSVIRPDTFSAIECATAEARVDALHLILCDRVCVSLQPAGQIKRRYILDVWVSGSFASHKTANSCHSLARGQFGHGLQPQYSCSLSFELGAVSVACLTLIAHKSLCVAVY